MPSFLKLYLAVFAVLNLKSRVFTVISPPTGNLRNVSVNVFFCHKTCFLHIIKILLLIILKWFYQNGIIYRLMMQI